MTMLKNRTVLWPLLATLLAACGGGGIEAVRARAPADLHCPAQSIQVQVASPSAPPAGPYYAEGCGKLWRYVSAGSNTQGTDAGAILSKQAAFDLSCSPDKLHVSRLNADTFGVTGCGSKASYILDCGTAGCKAIQNTQTQ